MAKYKEILVSVDDFETRVAILEDRQLVEFYIEEADKPRVSGNIYKGRIADILPGMEASFVDIGLERNAFLFVNEVVGTVADVDSPPHDIEKLLKSQQELLVQVLKEPVGNKGARVTTQISLAGRKVVLMPLAGFVGVSKRIEGEERARLQAFADEICPPDMGLIVRTAAMGAERAEMEADLSFLLRVWDGIRDRDTQIHAPALVHTDLDLSGRVVRDILTAEYDRLVVDSRNTKDALQALVVKMAPELKDRISHYRGKLPLFHKHNVESQLETALKRRVWLRSGGYIAIDRTEALTAIDVNTAKYTGGRNLEQTTYKTNLEAADEVSRQLRLRDIGGIIVIDFIDMQEPAHREALFEAFSRALAADRTKSRVIEISRLGLVEMTRKSMSEGVKTHFYDPCPICGEGKVLSTKRAAIEAYRKMDRLVLTHASKAFIFKVAPDVAEFLDREEWIERLSGNSEKLIHIQPSPGLERGEAIVLLEGSSAKIEKYLHGRV